MDKWGGEVGNIIIKGNQMAKKYKLQELDISSDWSILQNEFYDIDPKDNIPEDDKFFNIYCLEDLLYLTKGMYHLDLGWYGSDKLTKPYTGFCIYLFRGNNWHDCEFLEKFRSQEKQVIVTKINEFIHAVNLGDYENKVGYRFDENDTTKENEFGNLHYYSARKLE